MSKSKNIPATGEAAGAGKTASGSSKDDDFDLESELAKLSPEEADMFVRALALAMRKRRVLIVGYLATAIAVILGLLWALYIYGKTRGSGEFMGWVFLVPLALGAICLIIFGRISRAIK